jgi:hypothetical protein
MGMTAQLILAHEECEQHSSDFLLTRVEGSWCVRACVCGGVCAKSAGEKMSAKQSHSLEGR